MQGNESKLCFSGRVVLPAKWRGSSLKKMRTLPRPKSALSAGATKWVVKYTALQCLQRQRRTSDSRMLT